MPRALFAGLVCIFLVFVCTTPAFSEAPQWRGDRGFGPHAVGFRLIEEFDQSRIFHSNPAWRGLDAKAERARPMRVYLWYPARAGKNPMRLGDFVRLAADDFDLGPGGKRSADADVPLPVLLERGMGEEKRRLLLATEMASLRGAEPLGERFPLIVLGQGLYFESPLSEVVLAEYLASHGYVVVTVPLLGTYSRLVNLRAADLETEVRDMEFAMAQARPLSYVDRDRLGVVGFDLGGMAGLLLCMRNPDVGAFVSLSSGILTRHSSGLPAVSPHYDEGRFVIPWLHMTPGPQGAELTPEILKAGGSLLDRKTSGDSYLLWFNSMNHGDYSSYALFGIENRIPAYWRPGHYDPRRLHETMCRYCLSFLDAYLKKDPAALQFLHQDPKTAGLSDVLPTVQFKPGAPVSPYAADYAYDIIARGTAAALPRIRQAAAADRSALRPDEDELNWLGHHLFLWWGRQKEAIDLFQLMTELFPQSTKAFDSLGQAWSILGDREKATGCFRKSLRLNPEDAEAKDGLKRLGVE